MVSGVAYSEVHKARLLFLLTDADNRLMIGFSSTRQLPYYVKDNYYMGQKVYWKGLELGASSLHRYCTRYQQQLSVSLTPTQYTLVLNLIACLAAALAGLPTNTPEI